MAKKNITTKITKLKNGQVDINLTCKCGKPIVKSDEYGMFCENECTREESIKAFNKLKKIFPFL